MADLLLADRPDVSDDDTAARTAQRRFRAETQRRRLIRKALEPWQRAPRPDAKTLAAPEHSPPPRPTKAAAPRHVTLLELLTWTYREQRAHRYLRREYDWFLWQSEQQGIEMAPMDRRPVHPDAALVHAAVMREVRLLRRQLRQRFVPQREAVRQALNAAEERVGIVVHFAEIGDRPERCSTEPRPYPMEPNSERRDAFCRSTIAGERRNILVLTSEVVTVFEEEWTLGGRKKMRRSAGGAKRVEVNYCPIEWRPSPEFIILSNRIADAWKAAIAAIADSLAGAELRSHVLTSGSTLHAQEAEE